MEKSERRVAFIPVRGGSKSIPQKNIQRIAGKPLVYWVIDAALNSGSIDDIYISTDDDEIAETIKKHPRSDQLSIVWRSAETASDTATTESAMLEFAQEHTFGTIVLLQATSPLTSGTDIKNAMDLYSTDPNCSGVLTVCRQERFTWEKKEDGYFQPQNYTVSRRPRRQEFDGFLVENGAIYVTGRKNLLASGNRISGNILCSEMPAYTYYELDEPSDWLIIETLLKQFKPVIAPAIPPNIRLFISDVDGVLTDAGMYYSEKGDELKKFNTRDGKGFELLRNKGITVGIITTENTQIVSERAKKLKIDILHQGIKEKGELLTEILKELNIQNSEVAYIGDDINDLPILKTVGFSACPADAMEEVKSVAHYVCKKKGGEGCVREIAELIIKQQAQNSSRSRSTP